MDAAEKNNQQKPSRKEKFEILGEVLNEMNYHELKQRNRFRQQWRKGSKVSYKVHKQQRWEPVSQDSKLKYFE